MILPAPEQEAQEREFPETLTTFPREILKKILMSGIPRYKLIGGFKMRKKDIEEKHVGVEKQRGEKDLAKGTSRNIESARHKKRRDEDEELDW
jgi:hypothetical protein